MSFLLRGSDLALLAASLACIVVGALAARGLVAQSAGLCAAAGGLAAAGVLIWRAGRATVEEDAAELANRRDEHRAHAWSGMPVTVAFGAERHVTSVQNVSLSGIALTWTRPRIRSGTRAVLHITGYLILPAMVIAEGHGMLRLAYTDEVPDTDRQRLRNDCIAGACSGEIAATGATGPARARRAVSQRG
jgi:hypothetical protein